jgi:hypothetical protein
MEKKNWWKLATVMVTTVLLLSLHPEIRAIGLLVGAMGMDAFVLFFEAQLLLIIGITYRQKIRPMLLRANSVAEKLDPFYFIPSRDLVRRYPPIAVHAIPFFVGLYFLLFANVYLYS